MDDDGRTALGISWGKVLGLQFPSCSCIGIICVWAASKGSFLGGRIEAQNHELPLMNANGSLSSSDIIVGSWDSEPLLHGRNRYPFLGVPEI